MHTKPISPFLFVAITTPQICLLGFDYIWRVTTFPIESLLTYAIGTSLCIALFFTFYLIKKNPKK